MSISYVTSYRPDTGRITSAGHFTYADEDQRQQLLNLHRVNPDDGVLSIFGDARTQYVVDGMLTARPTFPCMLSKGAMLADGKDVLTISPVPPGASVMGHVVEDGVFEFTTALPGTYRFPLRLFPYIDAEFRLEAS